MRRAASELSIEWPPSMPIKDATRPLATAWRTSAAVVANWNDYIAEWLEKIAKSGKSLQGVTPPGTS